jgi:hypothetical protein
VRSGEVRGDLCVLFTKAVRAGESVTVDYGERYMLHSKSRLLQFREHELRAVVEAVLGGFEARVLRALGVYMGT